MITVEYWENGQLKDTIRIDRNESLAYIGVYNRRAERRNMAGRWIIASNGLRN